MNKEKFRRLPVTSTPIPDESKSAGIQDPCKAVLIVSGSHAHLTKLAIDTGKTNLGTTSNELISPEDTVAPEKEILPSDVTKKSMSQGSDGFSGQVANAAVAPFVDRRQHDRRRSMRAGQESAPSLPSPAGAVMGPQNGKHSTNIPANDNARGDRETGPSLATPSANGTATSVRAHSNTITILVMSRNMNLLRVLSQRLANEPDITVLAETIAHPTLLPSRLGQHQPDVLLLDKVLLGELNPQALQSIRAKAPKMRVLLLWDEPCAGLVEEILRNRFHGYLRTGCPSHVCAKAIRAVSRGDIWLPRNLLAMALSNLLQTPEQVEVPEKDHRDRTEPAGSLTNREKQLVELLKQGLTNKQIARRLDIMEDTVKKHLQSVFTKLGVRRRTLVMLRQLAMQPDRA